MIDSDYNKSINTGNLLMDEILHLHVHLKLDKSIR